MTNSTDSVPGCVVHVVDDDPSVRAAIVRLLKTVGYEVRAHSSPASYLLETPTAKPECMILDVRMPGITGLEMQEALARRGDPIPIVFLSAHGDIPMSVRAMRGGAIDFLTKPVKREPLLAAVRRALLQDQLRRSNREATDDTQARFESLTPREREVFDGVVAGKLNKQVGAEIGAAERTVKAHRASVMEKMGVTSVADLVRLAERLLRPER